MDNSTMDNNSAVHEYAKFVVDQNQIIMGVGDGGNQPRVVHDGTSVIVEMSHDEYENMMSAGGMTLNFRSEEGDQLVTVPVHNTQEVHQIGEQQIAQEQNGEEHAPESQDTVKVPAQLPEGFAYKFDRGPQGRLVGVVASKEVELGVKFGPFTGDFVSEVIGCNNIAAWEVCVKGRTWFYIDGSTDPDNWMMHVAVAQNKEEQNLEAFQFYGNIFFRTTKPLSDGDELKVFYDDDYRISAGCLASLDDLRVDQESGRFRCELCECQYANSKSMVRHLKFAHRITAVELDSTPPDQTPHCKKTSEKTQPILQDHLKASYQNFYQQRDMENRQKRKSKAAKKRKETNQDWKTECRKPLNQANTPQEQQKSSNPPEETDYLLKEKENLLKETENLHKETENLPKDNENLHKETEIHPEKVENVSEDTENVPHKSESPPKENMRKTRGKKFVLPPGLIKKEQIDVDEDRETTKDKKKKKKKIEVVGTKKKKKVEEKQCEEEEEEEEKQYVCKKCDKQFKSQIQLREHNAFHREEKELKPACDVCGLVCENKRNLANHKMVHEPDTHQCHVCHWMFRKKSSCIYHLRHVHDIDVGDKHLRGKLAEKMERFVGTDPDPTEQEVFHPEAPKDMLGRRVIDACRKPKVFKCKYCPRRFPEHHLAASHEKIYHLNAGEYRCEICLKSFAREHSLILHRRKHTKDRPFKCSNCPKSFGSESALRRHEPEHTGGRPFACDICGATFRARNAMNTHKRRTHSTQILKCSFCDMTFKVKGSLDRHEKRHKGIRPFVCLTCGKAFGTKYSLQLHDNIHTGALPFECNLCQKRFSTNHRLIYHMIKHGDPQVELTHGDTSQDADEVTIDAGSI